VFWYSATWTFVGEHVKSRFFFLWTFLLWLWWWRCFQFFPLCLFLASLMPGELNAITSANNTAITSATILRNIVDALSLPITTSPP
jgi:hypothetical protein